MSMLVAAKLILLGYGMLMVILSGVLIDDGVSVNFWASAPAGLGAATIVFAAFL